MFPKKPLKSQLPDTSSYTIKHCHTTTDQPAEWYTRECIRTMSIDPGLRNLAIRIENRNRTKNTIAVEAFEKIDFLGDAGDERVTINYIDRNILLFFDKFLIVE